MRVSERTSIRNGDLDRLHGAQEGYPNPAAQRDGSTCGGKRMTIKQVPIRCAPARVLFAIPGRLAADNPRRQVDWSKHKKRQQQ